MGIPLYFKIISDRYPEIIMDDIHNKESLFLDLNCAIHPCCRKIIEEYNTNKNVSIDIIESRMINETINYIEKLTKLVNPQLLYIAIDGVAPCAKMNQQRLRRYKSVYEKDKHNKIKEKLGILKKDFSWDTNAISPGTKFMDKLIKKINASIRVNKIYSKIKVIFDDSNNPGEGEHKIIKFIKDTSNNLTGNIIIYGLDADLIMLSFVSHINKIFLLREALQFGKPILNKFLYLDIDNLKYYIIKDIQDKILAQDPTIIFTTNKLFNLMDDYIFICFLVGNDFIPHLPSYGLRDNGLNNLLEIYIELYVMYNDNLIDVKKNKINNNFLKNYFKNISCKENRLLKSMSDHRKRFKLNKKYKDELEKEIDLLNMSPMINQECEKYIDIGSKNWESRYYSKCMKIFDKDDIEMSCLNYITGLQWTFHYYFKDCVSWKWKYNYSYSPSSKDIYNYLNSNNINNIKFKNDSPVNPITQLLYILPKSSINIVPNQYKKIMGNDSELADIYPAEYSIETYYKRYFWQCEPVLPLIDISRIINSVKKIK